MTFTTKTRVHVRCVLIFFFFVQFISIKLLLNACKYCLFQYSCTKNEIVIVTTLILI